MNLLLIAIACGVIAVLYGILTSRQVLASPAGNQRMRGGWPEKRPKQLREHTPMHWSWQRIRSSPLGVGSCPRLKTRPRCAHACTIQRSVNGPFPLGEDGPKYTPRNPRCGGSATAAPGNILGFPSFGLTTSTTIALGPGTAELGQNLFNFAPYNYFQRPDERYIAGAFADYGINDQIKPYLEFMQSR